MAAGMLASVVFLTMYILEKVTFAISTYFEEDNDVLILPVKLHRDHKSSSSNMSWSFAACHSPELLFYR